MADAAAGPSPSTPGALVRRTVRRQWRALVGSTVLITLWQVCELLVPVLIGVVIDRAVATGDWSAAATWGVVLCGHFALLSYSYRFGARIGFAALQRESHALRTEVSAHVLAPRGARSDRLPGDVLTVATADAEMVGTVVRQVSLTAAGVVGLLVSAVVLATIDPLLALVVLLGVPCVLGTTHRLTPRLVRRSEARQEALGRATGIATDLVHGIRPLKGIGAEETALARYRRESQEAAGASVGAARWEGLLYGVTDGLSGAFLAVVALVAGLRAVEGDIGVGELVAVVGLAQFVAEPMMMLTYLVAQVAQSRASAARIVALLQTPPLVLEGGSAPTGPTGLELDAVTSGPLDGVTLRAGPDELVAVVAEDPADAAALMSLLRGEAAPDGGRVLLDGAVLTELPVTEAHARLLVADHHVDLFEGTIATNVDPADVLGPDRMAAVLAASAADDVVAHAAAGLQEAVTVGGTTLSGGQRQRLGLARALAKDAPVLVLHDPTSAVDAVTEQRIADALHDVRHDPASATHGAAAERPRTTLLVTSSPAWLARADRVVHLRGGRVVAVGTHHELVDDEAYRAAVLR